MSPSRPFTVAMVSVFLMAACGDGSAGSGPARLGSTGVTVELLVRDEKGHCQYVVEDGKGGGITRFLGPAMQADSAPPQVVDEGGGRYLVTWGSGPAAAFVRVDTAGRRILSDSNGANGEVTF